MTPALAISGSNLLGDTPYSCALRTMGGLHAAESPAGARGDPAALAAALGAAHGVGAADLRELRLDLGPGSYTGLRVAVTFARFLAAYGEITVLACDSLALLAAGTRPAPQSRIVPLLDARGGRWHRGALRWHAANELRHEEPSCAITWAEVVAGLRPDDAVVAPPSLAPRLDEQLAAAGLALRCRAVARVTAADLFSDSLPLQRCAPEQLAPRYLMNTYADR